VHWIALIFSFQAAVPSNQYVDSPACARCQREIDPTYRQSGIGRSLFMPADGNTIEDYSTNHDFEHAVSDMHFATTICGVVGSGNPARFVSAPNGKRRIHRTAARLVSRLEYQSAKRVYLLTRSAPYMPGTVDVPKPATVNSFCRKPAPNPNFPTEFRLSTLKRLICIGNFVETIKTMLPIRRGPAAYVSGAVLVSTCSDSVIVPFQNSLMKLRCEPIRRYAIYVMVVGEERDVHLGNGLNAVS
jgi:hypothetical protein